MKEMWAKSKLIGFAVAAVLLVGAIPAAAMTFRAPEAEYSAMPLEQPVRTATPTRTATPVPTATRTATPVNTPTPLSTPVPPPAPDLGPPPPPPLDVPANAPPDRPAVRAAPVGAPIPTGPTPQPPATADLRASKFDFPDPVSIRDTLSYTITIANDGPNTATGVTVSDVLDGSVTFVSATPSPRRGTCSLIQGGVKCSIGTLQAGESLTVTVLVKPTKAGALTNTVSVTGNELDPNPSNNTAQVQTTVLRR